MITCFYTAYCTNITLQKLLVYPKLSRSEQEYYDIGLYEGKKIKSFRAVSGGGKYNSIRVALGAEYKLDPEKAFVENGREWLILDEPKLVVISPNEKINDNDVLTPAVILTVTNDGDNAFTVYLPLGECCNYKANEKEVNHYFRGGYNWDERPFAQIISGLRKGKKICYTFCWVYIMDKDTLIERKEYGGFRIL